jgi:hypothetical protein
LVVLANTCLKTGWRDAAVFRLSRGGVGYIVVPPFQNIILSSSLIAACFTCSENNSNILSLFS